MRIAYLSTFYPYRGGISQFNGSLFKAFQKEHEIKAFNFSRQYPDLLFPGSSQYVTPGDKAEVIPSERVLDTINPFSYLTTASRIRKFNADILLMKYWLPFFAPSLGTVSMLTKKKSTVITILDNVIPHEKRPGDKVLTRFFLKQNHGFVVMSESVKNDLLQFNPAARFIYHPHPLFTHFGEKLDPEEARRKLGLSREKKILLFFGLIRDYKGLDLLIEAAKYLDQSYQIIIAGESYGDFDKYLQQIKMLGIEDRFRLFVRYIPDEEVPLFFSAADVCVLPYKSATQSGITSIAFHFDLPAIVTNVGGLPEIVKHQEYGLVIDSLSPEKLSQSIINYFRQNLHAQFKTNIQRFKMHSSWEHLAKEIIEFAQALKS